jgi:hypothetical protein
MDRVQKGSVSELYAPSSERFRFYPTFQLDCLKLRNLVVKPCLFNMHHKDEIIVETECTALCKILIPSLLYPPSSVNRPSSVYGRFSRNSLSREWLQVQLKPAQEHIGKIKVPQKSYPEPLQMIPVQRENATDKVQQEFDCGRLCSVEKLNVYQGRIWRGPRPSPWSLHKTVIEFMDFNEALE